LKGSAELRKLPPTQGIRGQFLEGTKTDAIGLAQGSIDGPGFGHSHLGIIEDQGGDIAGMGVAVTHKPAALSGLIDSCFEDPEVLVRVAEGKYGFSDDTRTMVTLGLLKQIAVRYIGETTPRPAGGSRSIARGGNDMRALIADLVPVRIS
jgi:hypothetical protein